MAESRLHVPEDEVEISDAALAIGRYFEGLDVCIFNDFPQHECPAMVSCTVCISWFICHRMDEETGE